MKRTWKRLQNLHKTDSEKLLWLFLQYEVAVSFTGSGWKSGVVSGYGIHRSTNDYAGSHLEQLSALTAEFQDYVFGHAGYDLKNQTEPVLNKHRNEDGFADAFFFVPRIVVAQENSEWKVGYFIESDLQEFENLFCADHTSQSSTCELVPRLTHEKYIAHCGKLLEHIHRGDIYEINHCVDFTGKSEAMNPVRVYQQLSVLSDAPMSCFYRNRNSWLMCGSPERFIARAGNKLISQPIKGTIRRGSSEQEDKVLREKLYNDPKERSENVMIVDLVRNDLSRVAMKGSVKVSELFGIHTFKTVHQMISTVECELKPETTFIQILKATFPMGSMTGAPKISAMKLAEEHESQSRGIYSGTVGHILPNGDFDFNVVIRSITWNAETGHVSAKAGGAITANSDPEKEYEECLLKAKAMMEALNPARV